MNTEKIARYLWLGRNDKDWYKEAESTFIELYGEFNLTLVAKMFAATSINTSLKSNITLFRKAYHEYCNGKPFSNYLPIIKAQLELAISGKDLSGAKISSFAKALSGDKDAVVVDIWIMRAFGYKQDSPHIQLYRRLESWIRKEAKAMGLQPREVQAMIWSGIRTETTGRSNPTRYCDMLKNVHYDLFNPRPDLFGVHQNYVTLQDENENTFDRDMLGAIGSVIDRTEP